MLPGVAANLLGLAYVAAADSRPDDARALLEEAAQIAEQSGAKGVAKWIEQSRPDFP